MTTEFNGTTVGLTLMWRLSISLLKDSISWIQTSIWRHITWRVDRQVLVSCRGFQQIYIGQTEIEVTAGGHCVQVWAASSHVIKSIVIIPSLLEYVHSKKLIGSARHRWRWHWYYLIIATPSGVRAWRSPGYGVTKRNGRDWGSRVIYRSRSSTRGHVASN